MQAAEILLTRPGAWRRWFAFLGGGVAWTFHLITIYVIGEFGCVGNWGVSSYFGVSRVALMILLVSSISLAFSLVATFIAHRDALRDARHRYATEDEGGEYLSKVGRPLNALLSLIILVESLPVFAYLHGC